MAAREHRLAALDARLAELDLPACLVTHPADLRYLTGFTGSSGALVVRPGAAQLFTDFRYQEQVRAEVDPGVRTRIVGRDLWGGIWKALAEAPPKVVGFDAQAITVAQAETFAAAEVSWTFRPVTGLGAPLRERKDAREVAAIQAAVDLVEAALAEAWRVVRVGVTERTIAVTLEAALRRLGSEWHPFATIVASGPRSALPHARTADRVLAAGDFLLVDCGAMVDGYCADLTRTVVVGRPPDERQSRAFAVVQAAQRAVFRGLTAGMTGAEGDRLARDVIEAAGMGEAFGHALGHGLGLELHEGPRLAQGHRGALPDGAVVTVEPGVYFGGWGGVRLEDDVHLTATGVTVLSHPAESLMTLG